VYFAHIILNIVIFSLPAGMWHAVQRGGAFCPTRPARRRKDGPAAVAGSGSDGIALRCVWSRNPP